MLGGSIPSRKPASIHSIHKMGSTTAPPAPAPTDSKPPLTVAIVGGGIGGVSLALALAAQGVPFHIYEAAPCFGEIGAGVCFGPNVLRALRGISPAVLRAYGRHVTANEDPGLASAFLTYRRGFRGAGGGGGGGGVGEREGKEREEEDEEQRRWVPEKLFDLVGRVQEIDGTQFPVRCSVHRAHLLDELVRLLPPGTASFGKQLVGIDEAPSSSSSSSPPPSTSSSEGEGEGGENKPITLRFADGSSATATAVVGCDGIKSVVRQHLHGAAARAEYSGHFGYRAMAPRADYERALGRDLATTGNLFLCRSGYAIAYPVDHGAAVNMFATCVQPGSRWPADTEWKVPSCREELLRDLGDGSWHPGVVEMLLRHGGGERWAMFHSPHDRPYVNKQGSNIALLGDAAHATTPHMGAGAGMAIEDAFVLGRLLGAVCRGGRAADVLPHALRAYDAVRRPRTQEVVRESRDNVARYVAIAGAEEGQGEGELERLREESQRKFEAIWDFDLERSLDDAMSVLEASIIASN